MGERERDRLVLVESREVGRLCGADRGQEEEKRRECGDES